MTIVGLLVQRRKIHIAHGDLGSSDLDQSGSFSAQLKTAVVTPLENAVSVSGTTVHCFYAVKMGVEYEKRYRQHFQSPDIRRHELHYN